MTTNPSNWTYPLFLFGEWDYLTGFRRAGQQPLPDDEEVLRSLQRRLMVVADGDHCRMLVPLMQRWLRERG